ncbi:NAD(P)H-dependent oxidoreductase [Oxalobacter paraformigenes]|uniref:Flavodoxin-like fold domain-containing protein n=1 Tax=Oxalobacter paraformigenes TaxID=556268 RepID=C3X2G4_9BURK|nr:NAD(P)H-dependent oxidoreductase [Oxalobacter paraformigenes]EEO27400.1 hypothetical protein OFAG_00553 [Oxalobacter paraformigenes]
MRHIFVVNASKHFGHSQGRLNDYLAGLAVETLKSLGHEVKTTRIDDGYDIAAEVEKFVWADAVIYQMPAWWMEAPWIMKKYVDEVFTAGHGKIYESDGRTRSDSGKKYGSGGLLQGKKYLFSITWNAPLEAFADPDQFFEGKGIDAVLFPFHKANQFIGMSPLPTFMCNDVIKDPHIANDAARYREHLQEAFGKR